MNKFFVRIFSFFFKELSEIYRQPKLILSLLLGPLLILVLFGMGYQSDPPRWRTILVIPAETREQVPLQDLRYAILANFTLVDIREDETAALEQLRNGEVDVVVLVPPDIKERLMRGNRSPVTFKYNEINPFNEQGIRYLAYAQVNEINRALLLHATRYVQEEAGSARDLLVDVRLNLEQFESSISAVQRADLQDVLSDLRYSLDILLTTPIPFVLTDNQRTEIVRIREQLRRLRSDLIEVEQTLNNNDLDEHELRIVATRDRISSIEKEVSTWTTLPPEVLISPLENQHENIRGYSLDFMSYYAPGVFALILQHMAVMLGALSLVRERQLGALELYRVSPVSMLQIILGKYISYLMLIGLIATLLMVLITSVLEVPFLGNTPEAVGLVALFLFSTLGFGFLISAVSSSDNQAVQLSMLILLLSIFFSGLLLPLEYFSDHFRIVGYLLPLTHCIGGLQDIMLRGFSPEQFTWISLIAMSAGTLLSVLIISGWQFKNPM